MIEIYILFSELKAPWGKVVNILTGSKINHASLVVREKGIDNLRNIFALHCDITIGCRWVSFETMNKITNPIDILYFGDVNPPSMLFENIETYDMNPWIMTRYWLTKGFKKQELPNCCTQPIISWLNYFRNSEVYSKEDNYSPIELWKTLKTRCPRKQSVMEKWKCKSLL